MASNNEQDRRETLADIVAQMRGRGEDGRMDRHLWNEYADRIESAWKREHAEIEANALAVGGLVEAERQRVVVSKTETTTVGNAAATRETLEAINRINTGGLKRLLVELVEADIFDGGLINKTISAVEKARRALSAPARNCDKFVTQPEMSRAYEEYRKSAMKNYGNGLTGRVPTAKQKPMTYDEWLLAPAAEEGAGK